MLKWAYRRVVVHQSCVAMDVWTGISKCWNYLVRALWRLCHEGRSDECSLNKMGSAPS